MRFTNPITGTVFSLILLFVFSSTASYAQQTIHYDNRQAEFNTAMELYKQEKYSAAQDAFNEFALRTSPDDALLKEDAKFYASMCAMKLHNRDVQHLIKTFIFEHPENPNINEASFQLANHYFKEEKYGAAIKWYDKVDKLSLPETQLSEYFFKTGFCHYARKEYNKADKSFYEIKDKNDFYGPLATYFYSHIKYLKRQYQTALEGFNSLKNHALFAQIVPFYITQIYLLQEKYDKIIEYAPPLLENITSERTAEIARIIAEAYYQKANYTKALEYFKQYESNVEEINDVEYYQIGFAHYHNKNYDQAAYYLQEVIGVEDSLTQNAAYHLGMCYIKQGKKNKAKTAFGIATQNDFDEEISEDALFNYAKLCFELDYSPFNEAINSFQRFIEKYPKSVRIDEAYDYLLKAVLSTKNYEEALKIIESIPNPTPEIHAAHQRLAYFRAMEYYADLDLKNAIDYLNQSLEYKQYNSEFAAMAYYWKADAFYRQEKFDKAIELYNKFLRTGGAINLDLYGKAYYNVAYAYFQQKKYKEAGMWFRKYEDNVDNEDINNMLCDAWNRTGDCYFITSMFSAAYDYYNKAASSCTYDADYAYYQKALSQGRLKQHRPKINSLLTLKEQHPTSTYIPGAVYEIGRTYHSNIENADSAIYYYNQYIENYPRGVKMKSALSALANLYYNKEQLNKSLDTYKDIVATYPGTNEAVNALEMIKNISVEMNDPDYYVNYVEDEGIDTDISELEKDSLKYKSAEKLYTENKIPQAMRAFDSYLDMYPEGYYSLEANYYYAQCADNEDQTEQALMAYENVIERANNPFTEESLLRAASICFDNENYTKAYTYFEGLAGITEQKERIMIARLGMMRSAFLIENYDKLIPAAQAVLNAEKINETQEREALNKLAKAYYNTDRYELALSTYKKLSHDVTSYEGGEARYFVALINHKLERDSIAETVVIEFSKANSPHRYWLAKGFLLLADIYTARGEYFQATHILKSIIDNYTNESDGIKLEAQDKLNEVKALEEAEAMQDKSRLIQPVDSIQRVDTIQPADSIRKHDQNTDKNLKDNENTEQDN
ncbi:MAG: tetratricopeptide repeat protein [Bacteroidota bacterium]|nr:tetratricopeptide repeat protein [Bacteroidota bacterium]